MEMEKMHRPQNSAVTDENVRRRTRERGGWKLNHSRWMRAAWALAAALFAVCASAAALEIEYRDGVDADNAYDERNAGVTPPSQVTSTDPNYITFATRRGAAYKIENGVLKQAQANWTYTRSDPDIYGVYTFTPVRTTNGTWETVNWTGGTIYNITNDLSGNVVTGAYGEHTGPTDVTIPGSGSTINLSGNGNIADTLTMYNAAGGGVGSTLRIGYHDGTGYANSHTPGEESGGAITAAGTVNIGYGAVGIYNGAAVTGTVTAYESGATSVYHKGGTVNGAAGDGIFVSGAGSSYNMTGGNITNYATVHFAGGNTEFRLHEETGTAGGVIDGDSTVTLDNGGNRFYHYGTTNPGVLTGNATVTINRDVTNDTDPDTSLHQAGNLYELFESGRIGDAGDITSTPSVTMDGGSALFNQYGDSAINGSSHITLDRGGASDDHMDHSSEFRQHGASTIRDEAIIDVLGGGNLFRQYETATIIDDVVVNMTAGGNTFRQYGADGTGLDRDPTHSASINDDAKINMSGGMSYYLQYDAATVNDDVEITMTGGQNQYSLYHTASINDSVDVEMTGGSNTIYQFGFNTHTNDDPDFSSSINDDTTILMTGGQNRYFLYDAATINNNTTITMDGGSGLFKQYDDSSINNDTTDTGVRVTMNGDDNTYLQHGNSSINSTSIITLNGDNSLFRRYGNSTIEDDAVVDLIAGDNNRFHMFQNSAIMEQAVVNINQDDSIGNFFLIDNYDPDGSLTDPYTFVPSASKPNPYPEISSVGVNGDAINMNGENSQLNVFTQAYGRVSTAAVGGSAPDGANIRMDGEGSRLNIFELYGDTSFNDYKVFMGSDTSELAIYHQQGGRKNGTVDITGGGNLFWLNGNADYHANTTISSGTGSYTGNNLVVIDIIGHSRPDTHAANPQDAVHAANPGFADDATLDLSGTTSGQNNMFLANGDVYGTITAGGGTTDNYVYIGYTQEKSNDASDPDSNRYSWYRNDGQYDLTSLSGATQYDPITGLPVDGTIPNNDKTADPDKGPDIGSYINLGADADDNTAQVNNTGHLNVKKIIGGGGALKVQVTAGDAYNIKGLDKNESDLIIPSTPGLNDTYPYMYPTRYAYAPDANSLWHSKSAAGEVPASYLDLEHTTDYSNYNDYLTYSILNQEAVNVGAYVDDDASAATGKTLYLSPTNVTIGAIKDMDTGTVDFDNSYGVIDLSSTLLYIPKQHDAHFIDYYLDNELYYGNTGSNYTDHAYGDFFDDEVVEHQAQITAGMVNVYAGSKLTIHPNYNEMGLATTETADYRNIIDNLNIVGMPADPVNCNGCGYTPYDPTAWAIVTLDRTTIHTETAGTTITHGTAGDGKVHYQNYAANVVVGTNGILQGFGEITSDTDHTPLRPNIVGDVAVLAGGMLRPYDGYYGERKVFDYANKVMYTVEDNGIFVVHGNALDANSAMPDYFNNANGDFDANVAKLKGLVMKIDGTTYFEHASRVSTRLFAELDETSTRLEIVSDGYDVSTGGIGHVPEGDTASIIRNWGDSIESTSLVFDEIAYSSIYLKNGVNDIWNFSPDRYAAIGSTKIWTGVAQHDKVQYVPTFGFVNEIKSKLDYSIYWGDPVVQDGETTYYYQVTYGTGSDTITALKNMPDANHLFNRDIVFSDMLGNWSFEKQADDRGVVLRYRQLAAHPHDGGIARDIPERNAIEAAKKLDEIRYPFYTKYNIADRSLDGLFEADPSLGAGYQTPHDETSANDYEYAHYDGNPYDTAGFNGDIKEFYYLDSISDQKFGNYRDYWVEDIENYFRALQLEATSAADINRAVRLVTPEAYVSMTNVNLAAMNSFITSRERNSVSALYLVENNPAPIPEDEFQYPMDRDMPTSFVENPVRFWTAALGGKFRQHGSGDEYGYTTHNTGVQLGAIKEIGDLYLGVTGGYIRSINRWSELQSKNKSDMYIGELLLGYRFGSAFVELTGNIGYMDHKMTRSTRLGNYLSGDTGYEPALDCDPTDNYYNGVYDVSYTGDFKDLVLGGGLRFGYQKVLWGKWLFLPSIGVQYQQTKNTDDFTEAGPEKAAFRMVFKKGDIERQTLRVPLMFRLNRGIAFNRTGPWIFTPEVRAGVTANLLDRGGEATYKWIGNPIPNRYMRAWGLEEKRFSCQLGASFEVSRRGRFYAAANYDLNYAKDNVSHNFSVQTGINF